ncbi:MAG: D-alanine--D-alanine ligase family protein [Gemmatimonadaceae bacterium]
MSRRKLRVLALAHPAHLPPDELDGLTDQQLLEVRAALDVGEGLRTLGHDVRLLGVAEELEPIREAVAEARPHVVFNLLEQFQSDSLRDHNLVSFLELLGVPYTGCGPRGLVLSRDKALSKKLLAYHDILVPAFETYPVGRKVRRPPELGFPLFVKSLTEHASLGVARASLVRSDEELEERVTFVHERVGTDAIAEQFIDGRELYVSVVGNERLRTFPTWELVVDDAPPDEPLIATAKVKHDVAYQSRRGVRLRAAQGLPRAVAAQIAWTSKRIYRLLELTGYARIDYRLDAAGRLYFLEANPNPDICAAEEFASAARAAGMAYPDLIQRIVNLGVRRAG